MAPLRFVPLSRFGLSAFALCLPFAFGACQKPDDDHGSSNGGTSASGGHGDPTGGQAPTGGKAGTGGQNSTGGQSAAGGQSGAGGRNNTGGEAAIGGRNGAGEGNGGSAGLAGGTPSGGAGAGTTASGGAQSGDGGSAGASTGGASGSGGAPNGECTRALLDALMDDYFAALSAGDPSGLPLAADVKFTENAQVSPIGMTPFWMNAGETKYSQRALDAEACSVAAMAVIPENGMDLPVAIRIRVEGGEMTEIETIVVRPGDYTASFAVDSDPAAIIAIADDVGWHDEVPEADRATRQALSSWIDKYFRAFPAGVCNVSSSCRRLENGGGDFSCAATCSADTPTTGGTFEPRVIVVDEVRGIAAGLTVFDFQTDGHLDMHMMKMSGGEVHAVHAILRDTNGESGWD